MPTKYPSQTADRFLLRLPDGMRNRISESADANNRTMTKEMVLRLQKSFEPTSEALPFPVQQAVEDEVEEKGCTAAEALINLVLAGRSQGGTVLNIRVAPGTTAKDVRDAISAALELIPPDSSLIYVRESVNKPDA